MFLLNGRLMIPVIRLYLFLQKHIFFIQVSRSDQIEVGPDRIGFTEPFFRRIAGKMVFLGSGGD